MARRDKRVRRPGLHRLRAEFTRPYLRGLHALGYGRKALRTLLNHLIESLREPAPIRYVELDGTARDVTHPQEFYVQLADEFAQAVGEGEPKAGIDDENLRRYLE